MYGYIDTYPDYLYHHGVKGMKWGVRKKSYTTFREASKKARADGLEARKKARESGELNGAGAVRKGNKIQRDAYKQSMSDQKRAGRSDIRNQYDDTKAAYKQAKKEYSKSYNKAHNYSSLHPVSQFVGKKAKAESDRRWNDAYDKANALSDAKSAYQQAKKDRKDAINKAYRDVNKNAKLGEKVVYNNKTRELAAKYMVDNNLSMKDATKRANSDARRNTAIIVGAYAAVTVASLYANKKR